MKRDFLPPEDERTDPRPIAPEFTLAERRPSRLKRVGEVLLRRLKFCGRWLFWSWQHGTTRHAGWVCGMEGLWW